MKAMMRRATRYFGVRATVLAAVTALAALGAWDVNGRYQAHRIVEEILAAKPSALRRLIVRDLPPVRRWADHRLIAADRLTVSELGRASPEEEKSVRLRASLALAPIDPRQAVLLRERLLDAPEEGMFRVIRAGLFPQTPDLIPWLEAASREPKRAESQRLRAGLALATFAPNRAESWPDDLLKFLTVRLLDANPDRQSELREDLTPIRKRLLASLTATFGDAKARDVVRENAARLIVAFGGDEPSLLANLACGATPEQYAILFPCLAGLSDRQTVAAALTAIAREQPAPDLSEANRVELGQRRADAALTLARLGEVGPALEVFHVVDDPEALSQFVHRARDRGLRPEHLLDCLGKIDEEPALIDADKERARFAVLLAFGDFQFTELPESDRGASIEELAASYRNDSRSAIHGATGWLLRHWGFDGRIAEVDRTPLPYDSTGRREWFVEQIGGQFLTFIVFPACPDGFLMGSPRSEAQRKVTEVLHRVRITRPFAISDREVRLDQWTDFMTSYRKKFPAGKPFMGFDIKRLESGDSNLLELRHRILSLANTGERVIRGGPVLRR